MARSADPTVRAALIDAAADRLAHGGVDALSIRGVAAAVGTSTMAVYTHFGSKDDLVAAVVQESFRRLAEQLAAVPRTDDAVRDLVGVATAYRRNALANANLYKVMFDVNPLHLTSPVDQARDPDDVQPLDIGLEAFGSLVDAVRRCTEAGLVAGDPAAVAVQLWAVAHGVVTLDLAGFLGPNGAEVFETATTALVIGLATASSRPGPTPKAAPGRRGRAKTN